VKNKLVLTPKQEDDLVNLAQDVADWQFTTALLLERSKSVVKEVRRLRKLITRKTK